MVPFKNLTRWAKREWSGRNPDKDYRFMNESPNTYKTDRENNPFSPALMDKMMKTHIGKYGKLVRPRIKPAIKKKEKANAKR